MLWIERKGKKLIMQEEDPQVELENYWNHEKSPQEKGMLYEQYIGFLYEDAGYKVEYTGITRGNNDRGRDLICHYQNKDLIIQCKYWDNNLISVKEVYYFYGTVCHYSALYSNRDVEGVFYTTTIFSYEASQVAKCFGINFFTNFLMPERFPIIKCKKYEDVKKYYLPCDWNYLALTLNTDKGDCYCLTIDEAERKGFRRAV